MFNGFGDPIEARRTFLLALDSEIGFQFQGRRKKKSIRPELPVEALQLKGAVRFQGRHGQSIPREHCLHGPLHGFIGSGGRSGSFGHHALKLGGIAIRVSHRPQCGLGQLPFPLHEAVQQAIE